MCHTTFDKSQHRYRQLERVADSSQELHRSLLTLLSSKKANWTLWGYLLVWNAEYERICRKLEYAVSNRNIYTSLWYTVGYFDTTMVRIFGINALNCYIRRLTLSGYMCILLHFTSWEISILSKGNVYFGYCL
jgi:hypothetical protein